MRILATALVAAMLAGPVTAQSLDNTNTSQSSSDSTIWQGGDNIRSGSAAAPSMNHTAPCVIGWSSGVAVVGIGVSGGGGTLNEDCVTREEALILTKLADMRGPARQAAVTHFCTNDESMRKTLVAMGWCRIASR